MELAALLKPEAVKVVGSMTSKKRLMRELGEIAASCYGLDVDDAVEALLDRESIGPTGVGKGVALPHARMDGIDRIVGVFMRLDQPVPFESVDRQPVDLVFSLFAPKDAGVSHLRALALVSRVMRDGSTCTKLRSNEEAGTLHAILTGLEANQAA
ncbi:PTS sugar transporter subunit IIA [Qingshengfaniella alkalisoli]|uniref:PTS lactose transporter subunit IIC n=1 Tax=Qingshengfaniella alkalisoli TaxID=2599296 RepID=A0A5B8J007_9RHOB|nr:PTS sugar transporter subunit IIA [Qingshengfaniella alkalisoli]QDY71244.1 PTS lactose transporter subunit IIC [Qingshengfaniella alkalisoli]